MLAGQALNGIMPSATEEVLRLRKELRLKDAEFSKERAILEQKNQQMEQQLKDSKDREESQKRIHETMINCLNSNDPSQTSQAISQLQQNEKQLKSDVNDLLSKNRMLHDEIDIKEKNYKRQLDDKDMKIKDLEIQIERMRLDQKQMQMEFDQDKKDLSIKLQNAFRDREQDSQKAEIKFKVENNDLKNEIERLKLMYQRDNEKLKSEFDMNLKEMRMIHEQEKFNLQYKAEKSNNDLSSLINKINTQGLNESHRSDKVIRKREELEQEIMSLHHEVEQIKVQYDVEISKITQDKVQAENKAMKLQKSLDKIKNAPKPVKIDLPVNNEQKQQDNAKVIQSLKEEVDCLLKENEKLNEQVKKFRKETLENQDYIEKLETNERKLRQQLKEKSTSDVTSEQVMELKKQINKEKRKNIEIQEQYNHLNDDFQKIRDLNLGEMLEKDKKITKLSKDLREAERKMLDIQSVFNSNQPQIIAHNRNPSPFGTLNLDHNHNRNISYNPLSTTLSNNTPNIRGYHQSQNSQLHYQQSPKVINNNGNSNNNPQIMCGVVQEGNQMMKTIPQLEYTLLKTCQRMADSAIRMECGLCFQVFETPDFDIHIMQDHPQPKHMRNQTQNAFPNTSTIANQNNLAPYSSNKNNNAAGKRYAEDLQASTQQLASLLQSSPRSKNVKSRDNNSGQQNKWIQNSRSFTCLLNDLNEIEEEEKVSTNQTNANNTTANNENTDQSYFKIQQQQQQQQTIKSKSPNMIQQQDSERTKSRNANNPNINGSSLQMSTLQSGNTIQSVLRSQKELKKQKSNLSITQTANTSRVQQQQPQSVTVLTACRTEIQNLKRENKKMSHQLQNQEQKIHDISKDCTQIKRHVKKDTKKQNVSSVADEIKGLLEKIVTIQGKDNGQPGSYTSRQNNNIPMSTDSIVELRSSASSVYNKKKKANHKKKRNDKSPLQNIVLSQNNHFVSNDNNQQSHRENKENMQLAAKHQTHVSNKLPRKNLQEQFNNHDKLENFSSSSSGDYSKRSIIAIEKRSKIIKKTEELCSNSPKRYKNYFEIIKSVVEPTTNSGSNSNQATARNNLRGHHRYSPTSTNDENSNSKLKQVRSQLRVHQNDHNQYQHSPNLNPAFQNLNTNPAYENTTNDNRNSRNMNMPFAISNSKYINNNFQNTINSSHNNLVLYDSSNTDIFKSKQLKYQPTVHLTTKEMQQHSKFHYHRSNESARQNEFDQQNYSIDMDGDAARHINILNNGSSSNNSSDDFEEAQTNRDRRQEVRRSNEKVPNLGEGIFQQQPENEFVTGRFCDNGAQGKSFLFKGNSNNNSHNNSTIRNHLKSNTRL
ncbi:UNKNOWN [Stylonychia lemnae]|uniref:Uncharacterized protein n=1 Tax=Stylonychia lemnae TaxID=5949 RepID=A0A078AP66_STYLE|nr:UNKNOWN [Stylonychia lemnae]|eukprot:CDW83112.1 UNKNOWN [Stylonychia lemnae]